MRTYQGRFEVIVQCLMKDFLSVAEKVDVGQWQSLNVKGDPKKVTWELREAVLAIGMSESMKQAQRDILPNLPWAEDHFLERVGGLPLNPPPSQAWWPFIQNGHSEHLNEGQFSHTYPERFWPKWAGVNSPEESWAGRRGIRFEYGDLNDVVNRLVENLLTRQAYLPVWFPEDTGAPSSERVPCTLGYLFMVRNKKLHVTYHIRSCDFMRHFRDDVYMAMRLGQWVKEKLNLPNLAMGDLTMHIGSFHIFDGDRPMVKHQLNRATYEGNTDLLRKLS